MALLCVQAAPAQAAQARTTVGASLTTARAQDGSYISWRDHIIDEAATAGFKLSGSDGLVMADIDFVGTRGNSDPYDGVFWLEQVRSSTPRPAFERARSEDSPEMPLPR